jgi:hypothetical protein
MAQIAMRFADADANKLLPCVANAIACTDSVWYCKMAKAFSLRQFQMRTLPCSVAHIGPQVAEHINTNMLAMAAITRHT